MLAPASTKEVFEEMLPTFFHRAVLSWLYIRRAMKREHPAHHNTLPGQLVGMTAQFFVGKLHPDSFSRKRRTKSRLASFAK